MTYGAIDVTLDYAGTRALDRVSATVPPGSITAVIGGDGAGKTSLLAAVAGSRTATSGRIDRPPPREIGVLPAAGGSWRDLTVAENLAFAAGVYGAGHAAITALLEQTGLAEARDRRADRLSGGMRQKLGLAMAMVHAPNLLVLDEPTTGVDPVSRAELWRLVARAAAGGTAVLVATTYLDEAERASRIVLLEAGRVVAAGSPDEVIATVPGAIGVSHAPPAGESAWRHGATWRVWAPDGRLPTGVEPAPPDLEDAVIVALLQREQEVAA